MMTIRERIGQRIADLRSERGMTQQQLADTADISRVHVSRIEQGKYAVSLDVLDRISTALGTKIELIED